MIVTTRSPDRAAPSRVRFSCVGGAVRVTAPNSTQRSINQAPIESCVYFPIKTHVDFAQTDATDLLIESLPLSDLSVGELQEIVEWASVTTEAQTAGGLRRAIERHFEEG